MAHWHVSKLLAYLDNNFPDWRAVHSDPYDAAEFYGIVVTEDKDITHYSELNFDELDYSVLGDGFDNTDSD